MVPSRGQGVTMVGAVWLCLWPPASGKEDRLSLLQGQTAEAEMFRKGKGSPECRTCGFGIQMRWFPIGAV